MTLPVTDRHEKGRSARTRRTAPGSRPHAAQDLEDSACFKGAKVSDNPRVHPLRSARSPNTQAPTWATIRSVPARICTRGNTVV
jgi:hypothetical protein